MQVAGRSRNSFLVDQVSQPRHHTAQPPAQAKNMDAANFTPEKSWALYMSEPSHLRMSVEKMRTVDRYFECYHGMFTDSLRYFEHFTQERIGPPSEGQRKLAAIADKILVQIGNKPIMTGHLRTYKTDTVATRMRVDLVFNHRILDGIIQQLNDSLPDELAWVDLCEAIYSKSEIRGPNDCDVDFAVPMIPFSTPWYFFTYPIRRTVLPLTEYQRTSLAFVPISVDYMFQHKACDTFNKGYESRRADGLSSHRTLVYRYNDDYDSMMEELGTHNALRRSENYNEMGAGYYFHATPTVPCIRAIMESTTSDSSGFITIYCVDTGHTCRVSLGERKRKSKMVDTYVMSVPRKSIGCERLMGDVSDNVLCVRDRSRCYALAVVKVEMILVPTPRNPAQIDIQ